MSQNARKPGERDTGPDTDPADRGPGASSGHESLPHERVLLGTGSAAEGYDPEEAGDGTREGDPIAGVRADSGTGTGTGTGSGSGDEGGDEGGR